jgi:hypothetical protein
VHSVASNRYCSSSKKIYLLAMMGKVLSKRSFDHLTLSKDQPFWTLEAMLSDGCFNILPCKQKKMVASSAHIY